MAFTPVPTKNAGDQFTSTEFNTYIRDNFASGVPDIFEAPGDMVYANAQDSAVRLPIGSQYMNLEVVLSGSDLIPQWGRSRQMVFSNSGSFSVPNGVVTKIPFTAPWHDSMGAWDNTEGLINLPSAYKGFSFLVTLYAYFDAHTTGGTLREISMRVGPTTALNWYNVITQAPCIANEPTHLNISSVVYMPMGYDNLYIGFYCLQKSGTSLTVPVFSAKIVLLR